MRLWASGSVHQRVPRLSSSADRRPHTGPRQRTRERVHVLPHPFPSYLYLSTGCRVCRVNVHTQGQNRHSDHKPNGRTSEPNRLTQTHAPDHEKESDPRVRDPGWADSEEAAPCEPNPATSRSQSTSPRLLKGSSRDEVAAGGAAGTPK